MKNLLNVVRIFLLPTVLLYSIGIKSQTCISNVGPEPCDPAISLAGSNQTICKGESITLGCASANNYCYRWIPDLGFNAPGDDMLAMPTITPEETAVYFLFVTDDNGNIIGQCDVEITVIDLQLDLGDNFDICPGETLTLTAEPEGASSYIYEWSTGETTKSIELSPTDVETYSVTVTSEEGCCVSDEITVGVIAGDPIELTISPEDAIYCGDPVTLEATVTPNTFDSYYFEWRNEAGDLVFYETTTDTLSSHDVETVETFEVTVTVEPNGCKASAEKQVFDGSEATSIQALLEGEGFYKIPIVIVGDMPGVHNPSGEEKLLVDDCSSFECGSSGVCVEDDAKLIIKVDGDQIGDLAVLLEANLDHFAFEYGYTDTKAYISKNENLCVCPDYFQAVKDKFNADNSAFWVWLYEDGNIGDGEDYLYILANVPSETTHYPIPGERRSFVDRVMEEVSISPLYSFASKGEQKLFCLEDALLDNYFSSPTEVEFLGSDINYSNIPVTGGPCAQNPELNCIAPSGIPIRIPSNNKLNFKLNPKLSGLVSKGALLAFTQFDNNQALYYSGRGKLINGGSGGLEFNGYYNQFEKSFPYTASLTLPQNQVSPIVIGEVEGSGVQITEYSDPGTGYMPSNLPSTNATGAGATYASFDGPGGSGQFVGVHSSFTTFSLATAHITKALFDKAEESNALLNPFNEGGILYRIDLTSPSSEWVYARADNWDPDLTHYYKWNCRIGAWQEIPDPSVDPNVKENVPFLFLFLQGIANGISCSVQLNCDLPEYGAENWHALLDAIGTIPIIGEAADLVNTVWYIVDGDYVNAAFSFAGLLVPGYQLIKNGPSFLLKLGDDIVNPSAFDNFAFGRIGCNGNRPGVVLVGHQKMMSGPCGFPSFNCKPLLEYLDNNPSINFTQSELDELGEFLMQTAAPATPSSIRHLLETNVDVAKVWRAALDNNLTSAQRLRLFETIADTKNAVLLSELLANPNNINGWKFLDNLYVVKLESGSRRPNDGNLVKKVTELLGDNNFMTKISATSDPAGGPDALEWVLRRNILAPCKACNPPNSSNAHLKDIDEYLSDVKDFMASDNSIKEGASELISLMRNGQVNQIDAVAQTLRVLKEKQGLNVIRFEVVIGNTNNEADILISSGLIELKSFAKGTISSIPSNGGFMNQMVAYIGTPQINSLDELTYIFDVRKLSKETASGDIPTNPFNNIADATEYVKTKIKTAMETGNNHASVFNARPSFFNQYILQNGDAVDTAQKFKTFLSEIDFNHEIFDFITVD